jgi:hypothetical protein
VSAVRSTAEGLLVALHDAGRRIGVVARVQDRDDMTRLVHLRVGVASEVLLDVHEPVGEVVISRDGTRVGVVTDGRADFFWWSR